MATDVVLGILTLRASISASVLIGRECSVIFDLHRCKVSWKASRRIPILTCRRRKSGKNWKGRGASTRTEGMFRQDYVVFSNEGVATPRLHKCDIS